MSKKLNLRGGEKIVLVKEVINEDIASDISDLSEHSFDSCKIMDSSSSFIDGDENVDGEENIAAPVEIVSQSTVPASPAPPRPTQQVPAAAQRLEPACQPSQMPDNELVTKTAPAPASTSFTDALDSICEQVGETLRQEINNVMGNLKAFLANELKNSEACTNTAVTALKSEVATLKMP